MALPMRPYPMMRTRRSVSDGQIRSGSHSPRSWARTNGATARSEARVRAMVSSAVDASWTPAALHSWAPSGRYGSAVSYPAVSR